MMQGQKNIKLTGNTRCLSVEPGTYNNSSNKSEYNRWQLIIVYNEM